jgi:putative ABC transport system permease protein
VGINYFKEVVFLGSNIKLMHEWIFICSLSMKLLWVNFQKTLVSCLLIAFSTALILYQLSLLWGFTQAGMVALDAIGGDIWVVPKGGQSFDFPAYVDSDYEAHVHSVAGVRSSRKVVVDFVAINSLSSMQHSVLLVGIDSLSGDAFAQPKNLISYGPESLIVDSSSMEIVGLSGLPAEVEINRKRAHAVASMDNISTFIGGPYAFSSYDSAIYWMGVPNDYCNFIVVDIEESAAVDSVVSNLQEKFPEVDIWHADDFGWQSSLFWMFRTGAGGALLMAALMGFIIGVIVISQTTYTTALERIDDLATIRAMGGDINLLRKVTAVQASFLSVFSGCVGILACFPIIEITRIFVVAWVLTTYWLVFLTLALAVIMSLLSSRTAIRFVEKVDPASVFRR